MTAKLAFNYSKYWWTWTM